MSGDQAPVGKFIDVFEHRDGHIIHKQVEKRGDRVFLRVKKKSVLSMLRK